MYLERPRNPEARELVSHRDQQCDGKVVTVENLYRGTHTVEADGVQRERRERGGEK